MSPVPALRLPLSVDLLGFVALLRRLQVPHRVIEEGGEQVLWVPSEDLAEQVRELYARYPEGSGEPQPVAVQAPPSVGFARLLRDHPMTAAVLLLTLVVAAVTLLGENLAAVRWLTFQDFWFYGGDIHFASFSAGMAEGQWWRLFSPMLLHFWIPGLGPLHLLFNGLWYWELGRRIEGVQGGLWLLVLTLAFGLVANAAQYMVGGPSVFGGLSGVLYGLLGHCWLFQMVAPRVDFRLPRGVVGLMLVWLLICLSGVFSALGVASIANAAHVGGLLAGCATGLLGGIWARLRR